MRIRRVMLRRSRYWSSGRAPKPTLADNMSGFDNRLRVEKRDGSSLFVSPARSAVGFGLERLPGRAANTPSASPQGAASGPWSLSVDRWVPRLHQCRCRLPYPMDGARREGSGRAGRFLSTGLGQDLNGSLRSRHLLPPLALLAAANSHGVRNAQGIGAFSQVRTGLNPAVASS